MVQIQSHAMWHISVSHSIDVTLKYVTRVHHASLQAARTHWLRRHGGRGFTLASLTCRDVIIVNRSTPVKCKFLPFNQILVSDATKQMMHVYDMRIYMSLSWNVNTRAMPSYWHFNFGRYILACYTRDPVSFVYQVFEGLRLTSPAVAFETVLLTPNILTEIRTNRSVVCFEQCQ